MTDYNDRKEYFKKYQREHRDKINKHSQNWKDKNHEHLLSYDKKYKLEHKEQVKASTQRWRATHPENKKRWDRKYRLTHPKSGWNSPGNEKKRAHNDKRQRELGHELINQPFDGCHRHHINKNQIICIPIDLHLSIPHAMNCSDSMKKINKAAFDYLTVSMKHVVEGD